MMPNISAERLARYKRIENGGHIVINYLVHKYGQSSGSLDILEAALAPLVDGEKDEAVPNIEKTLIEWLLSYSAGASLDAIPLSDVCALAQKLSDEARP